MGNRTRFAFIDLEECFELKKRLIKLIENVLNGSEEMKSLRGRKLQYATVIMYISHVG